MIFRKRKPLDSKEIQNIEFEYLRLSIRQLKRRNAVHKEAMRLEKKRKTNYVS